jgi:hypothetical protein
MERFFRMLLLATLLMSVTANCSGLSGTISLANCSSAPLANNLWVLPSSFQTTIIPFLNPSLSVCADPGESELAVLLPRSCNLSVWQQKGMWSTFGTEQPGGVGYVCLEAIVSSSGNSAVNFLTCNGPGGGGPSPPSQNWAYVETQNFTGGLFINQEFGLCMLAC